MIFLKQAVELTFIAFHILEDKLFQPLIAKLQSLLLYRIEVIDPYYRERERLVFLLQVLLRVLLYPLH